MIALMSFVTSSVCVTWSSCVHVLVGLVGVGNVSRIVSSAVVNGCEWAVPSTPDASRESQTPQLAQLKNSILEKRKEMLGLPAF